jgi:hypothetical protein
MHERLKRTLSRVAAFYNERLVGNVGSLGFRRSTDLETLMGCLPQLLDSGIIRPGRSLFCDLGCADGRVNVLLSYLVKTSVGIELDDWTLEEDTRLRAKLDRIIALEGLLPVPENIFLFHGDSTDRAVQAAVATRSGVAMHEFDLFYTYFVMLEEFAELIVAEGKPGAVYMIYGLDEIRPDYPGLKPLYLPDPLPGPLALYRKP